MNTDGMVPGDWFMYCWDCLFQAPVRRELPECPVCEADLYTYDITASGELVERRVGNFLRAELQAMRKKDGE